ncbi:hypothetical protein AB0D13_21730 [Streptomyces sp. NPDC048430]
MISDEHRRGPAGKLHNTAEDARIQVDHRRVLARWADTVEQAAKTVRHRA